MIQNEINQMIQKISKDKIALHKLVNKGYILYSKKPEYVGAIAIINSQNKAVISYLQEKNDESQVIATACFENGCTLIYTLSGDKYDLRQTGNLLNMNGYYTSKVYSPDKVGIKKDVNSIRKRCIERSNKKTFDKKFKQDKISKDIALELLNNTLMKLDKVNNINQNSEYDKTYEI